nr:MAG: seryl-tRNA synthetase [Thermoproteus sp. AZ2]
MSWSVLEALRTNPDLVRNSLKARRMDPSLVDQFISLDLKWRELHKAVDDMRHRYNLLTKEASKASPEERRRLAEEAKSLAAELKKAEDELKAIEAKREQLLYGFPNLIHESVPICPEGVDSVALRYWGEVKVGEGSASAVPQGVPYKVLDWEPVGHADMAEKVLGLVDTITAGEVAGSRFYYLFEDLVWLDFALALYALDFLASKGFKVVVPPYMLKHEIIRGVIDLDTFKDAIYKIEGEDLYLIATAEHSLAAYLHDKDLLESDLPVLFAGWSPAFRKEAGAGNRDIKGIFRVHVFHKVEQYVFSLPEESWDWHEKITSNTEELIRGLGLPYRVVNICAHDLGAPAAKKYDIEVWYPSQGIYRELASCSNTTDWQSYRLRIRVIRKGFKKEYVHTLNCTGLATTRTITAILENYQNKDGYVEIPKALKPYLEPIKSAPKDYIAPRAKK